MECPKCESNIKDVARFCEFCGHHFSSKEISARQVPQEEINTKTNEINVTESEIQLAPFYIRLLHSFIDHLTAWFIVFYINGYFEFIVGDLQDINNIQVFLLSGSFPDHLKTAIQEHQLDLIEQLSTMLLMLKSGVSLDEKESMGEEI